MPAFGSTVYFLCFLASATVTVLLLRSYPHNKSSLVLWSGIAFIAFTLNNLFLFVDLVLLPSVDLRSVRDIFALAGVGLLIYSFVWKSN